MGNAEEMNAGYMQAWFQIADEIRNTFIKKFGRDAWTEMVMNKTYRTGIDMYTAAVRKLGDA